MSEEQKEPAVAWAMTFTVREDGTRDLAVEGTPSIAQMLSEFNTMIENLRAQLFVDKLMEQGRKTESRVIRPS